MIVLPPPHCMFGYTRDQLEEILGKNIDVFDKWMLGKTGAICDARRWDAQGQQYVPTACGPHGDVVYEWDLITFLSAQSVTD